MHFYLGNLVCQGAETYRSGTQTKASGLVKGKNAKKALGSMLDANIAHMGTPGGSSSSAGGNKGRGKGKAKAKAAAGKAKTQAPQDKEKKELQKDIKAFPGYNSCSVESNPQEFRVLELALHGLGCVTKAARHKKLPLT